MVWQALIGAAALLALVYGACFAARPEGSASWAGTLIKTGASGALAIGFALGGAPGLLVGGLALGAVGDFALSRPGARWFVAGMAAFAAGHLAYTAWMWGQGEGLAGPSADPGSVMALTALAALAASTETWLAPHAGALRIPVRGYVLVISLMGAAAILLPPTGWQRPVQLGAALFILSDLILAVRLFRTRDPVWKRRLGVLVWPLYFSGQAMILLFGAAYAGIRLG